jgi:hypothetical protein
MLCLRREYRNTMYYTWAPYRNEVRHSANTSPTETAQGYPLLCAFAVQVVPITSFTTYVLSGVSHQKGRIVMGTIIPLVHEATFPMAF